MIEAIAVRLEVVLLDMVVRWSTMIYLPTEQKCLD
jgi:hypothetical protein